MISFSKPEFNLSQLEPGSHYSIKLFAENKIGAGPAITLLADTHRLAEKRTAESKIALQSAGVTPSDSDIIMIIIGVISAVIIMIGAVITAMIILLRQRTRYSRSHDNSSLASGHSGHSSSHLGPDTESRILQRK